MKDKLRQSAYWAGHIARHAPGLAFDAASNAIAARSFAKPSPRKIIVATHHKVLTVFLSRVFRVFATITNRSFDLNPGKRMDYSRDVLIDFMSVLDWEQVPEGAFGLHVIRDPRDIIVSSAFYHTRSTESWLHQPHEDFGGQTYQQMINSLPDIEARLLFEINNASGNNIRRMLAWEYGRPGITEMRYERLVGDGADENFARAIVHWPLTERERRLLLALFRYFSLGGPGTKASKHIRNPESGQCRKHFTPRVEAEFARVFPDAVERLGFAGSAG